MRTHTDKRDDKEARERRYIPWNGRANGVFVKCFNDNIFSYILAFTLLSAIFSISMWLLLVDFPIFDFEFLSCVKVNLVSYLTVLFEIRTAKVQGGRGREGVRCVSA